MGDAAASFEQACGSNNNLLYNTWETANQA